MNTKVNSEAAVSSAPTSRVVDNSKFGAEVAEETGVPLDSLPPVRFSNHTTREGDFEFEEGLRVRRPSGK